MLRFKDLMERINETRSFYLEEEVEELDEANENFDSNSKAHQAAKKAVKGWRGMSKATYHSDGSATINTKDKTKNRYGKHGHYSGLETTPSHAAVDQHLKYAGGMHNHSKDEYDNHHQKIDGLHWKVKGKATSYGRTHEIHIHEELDGLHEISAMKAIRTSVKREVSGVTKSIQTGDPDDAGQKKIDKNKERIHKKYGYRAANIAHNAAGKKLDYVDGPYRPKPSMRKEEVEGLDELSRETVRTYYNKSIAQGKPIADKMKMGGGDHSSDGSDTKTLKKRAAGVTMALKRRRGEVKMSEEADLEEGRMKDLAMDMESLSHADFKRKHRRTKQEMQSSLKSEALKGDQHKIDANKNGKVDGHDFKILRNAKKARYQ